MTEEIAASWSRVIIVCGTCSKRVGGGWGGKGRTPLAKALRRELGVSKGQRASVGVVETRCLGPCPASGVILLDAARPERWLVARPGETPAAVLATLVMSEERETVVEAAPPPTSLADWRGVLRPGTES